MSGNAKGDKYALAGDEWWSQLAKIATELYPRGPEEMEVWRRAGGDLSVLELNVPSRAVGSPRYSN